MYLKHAVDGTENSHAVDDEVRAAGFMSLSDIYPAATIQFHALLRIDALLFYSGVGY